MKIFNSTKKDEASLWKYYKFFYISQSTAFIVPILYLYLQNTLNISPVTILQVSAIYWIVSLLLQLPCGVLADRWGIKTNLYCYLFLQICSCISLIFFESVVAYHMYLICCTIAQALGSGADSILIRKQFMSNENEDFKKYIFDLQNSFYKLTSGIIFISSCLYTLSEKLPFFLQIINFCISWFYLKLIPEKQISVRKSEANVFTCAKEDLKKSLTVIFKDNNYFFLVICFTLFNVGVGINQKAIQPQLYTLFENHQVVFIGAIIAIGNLFSSFGSKFFYKLISRKFSSSIELLVLSGILVLSYLFMSVDHLSAVVVGFMLINLFKGCYRPVLGADLVNEYPFKSSLGTNSAIVYSLSVIFAAGFQFILASYYGEIEYGNIIFALWTSLIISVVFYISLFPSKWKYDSKENPLTGKKGSVQKRKDELIYIQVYPPSTPIEHLKHLSEVTKLGRYPASPARIFSNAKEQGIETLFLGELHLSDVLDSQKQYEICEKLLYQSNACLPFNLPKARIPPAYTIFHPELLNLLNQEPQLSQQCIVHGDLHPENIMLINDCPYVIDWDLCGIGPLWYDLFSLLSHPQLYLDKSNRYKLLIKYYEVNLKHNQLDELFFSFSQFKIHQLTQFAEKDKKFSRLSTKYANNLSFYANS